MGRGDLTNEEWRRLEPHLPLCGRRGGRWVSHRRVINGILFRERTGIPWRDLPERFGRWKTVYERHRRWSADGTWDRILQAVQADADAEGRIDWSMVGVDSTCCRAHTPPEPAGRHPAFRKKSHTPAASPRRGTRKVPGRSDEQDSPRQRRWSQTSRTADHPRPMGRRTTDDPRTRTHPSGPQGRGAPAHPAGTPERGQGVVLPQEPPLPAQTPYQAHRCRAEGPEGQPSAPREPRGPAHWVRQGAVQAPQRSRADDQPPDELSRRRDPLRQASLRLPRHRHGGHDPPLAASVTRQRRLSR